jgi:hypothetical protein
MIEAFLLTLMLIIVGSRRDLGQPLAALFSIPLPCLFLPVPAGSGQPKSARLWGGTGARAMLARSFHPGARDASNESRHGTGGGRSRTPPVTLPLE